MPFRLRPMQSFSKGAAKFFIVIDAECMIPEGLKPFAVSTIKPW
jgi:hypothetical protein